MEQGRTIQRQGGGARKVLRWYLACLVFLLVVSPGVGYAVYQYVMDNPAEPGTLVGRIYETAIKRKLLAGCGDMMTEYATAQTNTEDQFDAACHCFADAMFNEVRSVPPGKLGEVTEAEATKQNALVMFKNCASQSGLN